MRKGRTLVEQQEHIHKKRVHLNAIMNESTEAFWWSREKNYLEGMIYGFSSARRTFEFIFPSAFMLIFPRSFDVSVVWEFAEAV